MQEQVEKDGTWVSVSKVALQTNFKPTVKQFLKVISRLFNSQNSVEEVCFDFYMEKHKEVLKEAGMDKLELCLVEDRLKKKVPVMIDDVARMVKTTRAKFQQRREELEQRNEDIKQKSDLLTAKLKQLTSINKDLKRLKSQDLRDQYLELGQEQVNKGLLRENEGFEFEIRILAGLEARLEKAVEAIPNILMDPFAELAALSLQEIPYVEWVTLRGYQSRQPQAKISEPVFFYRDPKTKKIIISKDKKPDKKEAFSALELFDLRQKYCKKDPTSRKNVFLFSENETSLGQWKPKCSQANREKWLDLSNRVIVDVKDTSDSLMVGLAPRTYYL